MKLTKLTLLCTALTCPTVIANPASEAKEKHQIPSTQNEIADGMKKHADGSKKLAAEQDDLSADVQDLIDEQTDPEIIDLLRQIEEIMADATDQLEQQNTDGSTIATQTEVIEKIFEAAKKKQQTQSNGSKSGKKSMSSMLEMMKHMMDGGRDLGEGQQPGQKPGNGKKSGNQPGQGGGGGGTSDGKTGAPDQTAENNQRRVPKSSGNTSDSLPREFQKAMDAYNKGALKETQKP